jgi:hypothetical protein
LNDEQGGGGEEQLPGKSATADSKQLAVEPKKTAKANPRELVLRNEK